MGSTVEQLIWEVIPAELIWEASFAEHVRILKTLTQIENNTIIREDSTYLLREDETKLLHESTYISTGVPIEPRIYRRN